MSSRFPRHGRTDSVPYSISSETAVGSEGRSSISSDTVNGDFTQSPIDNTRHSRDGTSNELDRLQQIPLTSQEPTVDSLIQTEAQQLKKKREVASWSDLPRKGQLALLTISRLSEPLTQTSLQSYMFYQLKSFDPALSDSQVSAQAGMMQAAFTAAQFLTAILWGRAADNERIGRKTVLMIGLIGTMISALGFGFSKSFLMAMFFRSLGGALNGNVGVMRTMISEIIKEKKFQSRAFMVLPMTFNIGVIIGPILGGLLSDPVGQYPWLFGPNTFIGGKTGVGWMITYPYALPNVASAVFLTISTTAVFLGLEETHEMLRHKPNRGRQVGLWLLRNVFRRTDRSTYSALPTSDNPDDPNAVDTKSKPKAGPPKPRRKLPISRIWTRNVVITLAAHGIMAMHVGTFNNVWFLFLSTPRFNPAAPYPPGATNTLPFKFTGGLAMPPARIGLALSILGTIGIFTQLFLYPRISARLGTHRSYQLFLALFPIAYLLAPYITLLPSTSAPPKEASGPAVWAGIAVVLAIQVMARTFALPGMTILVNNSCPHPTVLGTLHGIAQSISSGMRSIGPALMGWTYGRGLEMGVVGLAFWGLCSIACVGYVAGSFVREGSGHEIILEEEEDEAIEMTSGTSKDAEK
ncbi:MFS general substrate transporter [Microthyrium microscopicum]|uniref:MFS general substrate transporter n=1 Tax=Microthyrium microscopicum TaxID=703497 RepID=A0A6A6UEP1_9PEZI|nr:MFS general substrate transporter [Microthyrium microscopicum]